MEVGLFVLGSPQMEEAVYVGYDGASVFVDMRNSSQVILPTAPAVSNEGGEFSPLGSLAGCFLAPGSGLWLVGTVPSRR